MFLMELEENRDFNGLFKMSLNQSGDERTSDDSEREEEKCYNEEREEIPCE